MNHHEWKQTEKRLKLLEFRDLMMEKYDISKADWKIFMKTQDTYYLNEQVLDIIQENFEKYMLGDK